MTKTNEQEKWANRKRQNHIQILRNMHIYTHRKSTKTKSESIIYEKDM